MSANVSGMSVQPDYYRDEACPMYDYRPLRLFHAAGVTSQNYRVTMFDVDFAYSFEGGREMYSPLVYARSQSAGAARPPVLTGTWIGLVWHGMVRFGWVDTIESTARSTGNVYLGVKMSADAGDGRLLVVVPISHVWVHTLKIGYCDKGHMQLADPLGVSFDKHCHVYPSEVWTAPNWIVPNPKVCHWACYLGYHPVLHPAFDARAVDVPADVRTTHELIEYVYPVFAKFNVSRDEVVAYIYSDDFMKLAADIARSLERECVYVGRPSSAA